MNALLLITAFLATVTIREIVQAVSEHVKAKDALKLANAEKEKAEIEKKVAEYEIEAALKMEYAAQRRKETEEIKSALADKIKSMNAEQLAAYNREMVKYVPVPTWTLYNQQQEILRWRGW